MLKLLCLVLAGLFSVGMAKAQLSDKQVDQVIDRLMDDNEISSYMSGDDGEDCFSDIDLHSIQQLESKEWAIEFDILHLEKHGCVHWTSISCEAKVSEGLDKILDSSCSY